MQNNHQHSQAEKHPHACLTDYLIFEFDFMNSCEFDRLDFKTGVLIGNVLFLLLRSFSWLWLFGWTFLLENIEDYVWLLSVFKILSSSLYGKLIQDTYHCSGTKMALILSTPSQDFIFQPQFLK